MKEENKSKPFFYVAEENNFPCENNSVALEIGKDFFLPNSSSSFSSSTSSIIMCPDDDDNNVLNCKSSSASSSSFQFHTRNEESHLMTECRREKNRKAAQKCREKKKERIRILEDAVKQLNDELRSLRFENNKLKEENEQLTFILNVHNKHCQMQLETEHFAEEKILIPMQTHGMQQTTSP